MASNSGHRNSGHRNSGNYNSGNYNSGNYNSGNYNSGYCNSGNYNSGNCNSGYCNSGYYNSGNYNSGNYNSGYCNSGNCNSGNCNSGNCNSGNCNSGNYNSGNYNSGNYNSGDCNSGHFNTTNPDKVRMFNKWIDINPEDVNIPCIHLPLNEWTDSGLVTRTYHEAWAIAWNDASPELKQRFIDLPGFDAEIFREITGIDVNAGAEPCTDKATIVINGKEFKLVPVEE